MNKFTKFVKDFWQDEEGLTAVEYAVAGGLIVVGVVAAFNALGVNVNRIIGLINTELDAVQ
ncbi:Flp family type IVb pilin [Vibrio fluvialis]|uniref:Flp family type IVb pilin n=1 Tax=Vibrio fluvialis TaxID=676 RepID=UPI001C9C572F|nr:Flp family type IVb pilin [Vibrio fluvialis]MBY7886730.1 Flp family type IVb pilin [Vibrio fluvialis]MBY7995213.1 Flp family type IVb pilin [Vibrio fluvialis]MBY8087132.1 Flp family type IVb pilin [Vibrio fluvialis]MBY8106763.1 Flp family type IVb pilin [Vibrio fluvialis]MBY8201849.1 Flp family type IVb pilin [Vibrio fluvialis]